ncbi:MAG: PEP-CTERM sorting domain-containing protein [Acidobacteriia bacterium]|nr:PEP-CTERM sorting domain-containing protein [Terriglobia bacterium]
MRSSRVCCFVGFLRAAVLAVAWMVPASAAITFDFSTGDGGFTSGGTPAWAYTTNWTLPGANSANATLTSPTMTASGGAVTLQFSHSRNMEGSFDGGVLEFSVGANPFLYIPNSQFTQNGYNGTSVDTGVNTALGTTGITPNSMFQGNLTNQISIAQLAANLNAGDLFRFRFHYASDPSVITSINTTWVITSATVDGVPEAVPEPATLPLILVGGIAIAALGRRRFHKLPVPPAHR